MKTDGRFGVHSVHIKARHKQPINLFCIGDVHRNSPNCAVDKWLADIKRIKEISKRESTYYIFTGDLLEYLSSSERRYFMGGGFHDTTIEKFEEACVKDIGMFCRETEFMKGKVLSIYGGNHYFSFASGETSDIAIAAQLKARYIGCSGYTIVNIDTDNNHTHTIRVFAHHGVGGGARVGSSFNKLEDASSYFSDADIILMGHNHQLGVAPISSLKCDRGQGGNFRIKAFDRWLGRTGSYLRSYVQDRPAYPVDTMMRPSRLGCLQFILQCERQQRKYGSVRQDERWVDVKAVI